MSFYILMIGVALAWNAVNCAPRSESALDSNSLESASAAVYDDNFEDGDSKAVNRLEKAILAKRPFEKTTQLRKPELARASGRSAIYGLDKLMDQLHENTGEKQPIYHSAREGWVF